MDPFELDLETTQEREAYSPYDIASIERFFARNLETGRLQITDQKVYVAPSNDYFEIRHIASLEILDSPLPLQFDLFVLLEQTRFFIRRKDMLTLEIERDAMDRKSFQTMIKTIVENDSTAKALGFGFKSDGNLVGPEGEIIVRAEPLIAAQFFRGNAENLKGELFFNRSIKSNVEIQSEEREQKVLKFMVDFLNDNPKVLSQLKAYVKERNQKK